MKKKILSLVLAFMLILSVVPMGAFSITAKAESNGVYEYTVSGGITITKYIGEETDVVIPETIDGKTVNSIGDDAFKNSSVTSVLIPNSVTSIGESAFYNCASLVNVKLSNKLTSIDALAFSHTAIESIFIPKTLTECDYTFYDYCRGPFAYCDYLTSATFEEGTKTIPSYVLASTAIEEVTIPDSVTVISKNAFVNCTNLKSLDLSDSLKSIGQEAFKNCVSLSEIVLPDSVTSVGQEAFYDCTSVESIQLSNELTSIDALAFSHTAIESIEIPKTLTECDYTYSGGVYYGPFSHNENLTTATFEEGTTVIPKYILGGCNNLEQIFIPETVTNINNAAFVACDITDVWYGGTEEDKAEITINNGNDVLATATWHYNSCNVNLEHAYDNACDANCNNCDKLREVPDHVYDNKDDLICNECGYERPPYEYGDVNEDGKINNKDVGILLQYINTWPVTINTFTADVNVDGKVNNKDIGILLQYINKWDVVLGK